MPCFGVQALKGSDYGFCIQFISQEPFQNTGYPNRPHARQIRAQLASMTSPQGRAAISGLISSSRL